MNTATTNLPGEAWKKRKDKWLQDGPDVTFDLRERSHKETNG